MSFLEIFQPGLRHLREERDRQKILVAQPTRGAGPPLGIDLAAGTARLVISIATDSDPTSAGSEASAAPSPDLPEPRGNTDSLS